MILLIMPLAQDGDYDQLRAVSELESGDLIEALERLITLSLVKVNGDLNDRRYRIHSLTRTWLLTDMIKQWQATRIM